MTNPIPFKAEVSGGLEEAPSGAIPISLYGDVGGGSGGNGVPGGPVETDESGLIASGEVYIEELGGALPWRLEVSREHGLRGLVAIDIGGDGVQWYPLAAVTKTHGEDSGSYLTAVTGIPRLVADGGVSGIYGYGDAPQPILAEEVGYFNFHKEIMVLGVQASSGEAVNRVQANTKGAKLESSTRNQYRSIVSTTPEGRASIISREDTGGAPRGVETLEISLENTADDSEIRAFRATEYINSSKEDDYLEPYITEVDDGIITLAALRKYVEDTIGYGGPGQVLATNSTGDGYEWVDGGAND